MTGNERYEAYALRALERGKLRTFLDMPSEIPTKTVADTDVLLSTLYRLHAKRPDLNIPEKFVEALKQFLGRNNVAYLVKTMEFINAQFRFESIGEANFKLVDQDLLDYFKLVTVENKELFDQIHGYIEEEYGSAMAMANGIVEEYTNRIAR